ncbi:MAG TPA: hypothetical protein VFZ77_07515 [Acidimicrobiales bacterium]
MAPSVIDPPAVSPQALRRLVGRQVLVRTPAALWRGTLLSCVTGSAWFVVDDVDVVVPLAELVSVRAA